MAMKAKGEARYGLWRSALSPRALFAQPSAPMYPFRYGGRLYWLEARAQEGGRIALMREGGEGGEGGECLTPREFNIRTAMHEYGGRCFCRLGGDLIFNNFADGRLYRQGLEGGNAQSMPQAVTAVAGNARAGFADLLGLPRYDAVVAVMEVAGEGGQQGDGAKKRDCLAVIQFADGLEGGAGASSSSSLVVPRVLVCGADFYACPVVSADARRIAWVEWDDPYMPWDESRLVVGDLVEGEGGLRVENRRVVVEEAERAVCQLGFVGDGELLFVSDGGEGGNNFWNFFGYGDGRVRQITEDEYEYGEAHWVFGNRRWREISGRRIVAVASGHEGDKLVVINYAGDGGELGVAEEVKAQSVERSVEKSAEKSAEKIPQTYRASSAEEFAVCADLWVDASMRELLFVAKYARRGAQVCAVDVAESLASVSVSVSVLALGVKGFDASAGEGEYSSPQAICYPTRDGGRAYAYFYAPYNRRYCASPSPSSSPSLPLEEADCKPPLLVVVHGGPTSRATPEAHPLKQFFTSLGYAVLDINHRGSTGYGRAYRQSLLGRWGELDASDIADGVRYVVEQGWVDGGLVFIRGGSAGGYAVLCALTQFGELFSGGACYYGIGNLLTLAQITHSFEGHYTGRLIGEKYDEGFAGAGNAASRFVQRSPIFHLHRLSCPLILFQGLKDKVVPPAVSREVVEALRKRGVAHEYIEYENEGHGFRALETRVDALKRETEFFAKIIRASKPD